MVFRQWKCAARSPTATSILANLCHSRGACYTDCQFSPPDEFNVNVPQALVWLRNDPAPLMSGPRICAAPFARNGLVISLIAALSVAAFIFGFAAYNDWQILFGVHTARARSTKTNAA